MKRKYFILGTIICIYIISFQTFWDMHVDLKLNKFYIVGYLRITFRKVQDTKTVVSPFNSSSKF